MTLHDGVPAVAFAAVLLCATVLAPVALIGPVQAQDNDGSAAIVEETVTQERGDVAEFTVELTNTSTAFVSVGSAESDYHVVFSVEDGGDDELNRSVTVRLNTYFARQNPRRAGLTLSQESQADDDSLTVVSVRAPEEPVSDPLDVGSYPIEVGTSQVPDNGLPDAQDEATLELTERATGEARTLTEPHIPALDFATREEFLEQIGYSVTEFRDRLSPTDRIAKEDWLVVQFDVSGVYGLVRTRSDLLGVGPAGNATGVMVTVEEENPPEMQAPRRVNLNDRDNVLLTDDRNNTMYLVLTTLPDTYQPDTVYRATLEINATSGLVSPDVGSEVATTTFVIDPREARITGLTDGAIRLAPETEQTVTGETTLAPGSELDVVLENGDDVSPYRLMATTEVTANRTFQATFDLSDIPAGSTFNVTVRNKDEAISDETPGRVVASNATATPTEMERPTATPTTETATETPGATPTPTETRTATGADDRTPSPTTGTGPGVGVTGAIAAVVLATLLVARRLS